MLKFTDKTIFRFLVSTILVVLTQAEAALPKVELQDAFPALRVDRPIWMSEAPDGTARFFIIEQHGRILIAKKGSSGANVTEFLNITARNPMVDNEEGLLSLAFHPQFKTNGLFYIYYNQQNPRRSVISEFKVSSNNPNKADLASERVLMQVPQPYGNHKGGQIGFGPDGFLYIALGDGGFANDPHNNGQNTATLLAKMLRVDVNSRSTIFQDWKRTQLEYGVPKDNPFVGENDKFGVRKEIWAYGLRNPWRYSWDRETGDLWLADVGQDEWEEINLIAKGGNYGWPVREGFHHFKPSPDGAKFVDPVIEYPHQPQNQKNTALTNHTTGLSITGGFVYRGKKYPSLRGAYVYGDYSLGTIWGIRYVNGKVTESDTLLSQPKNIVSFAEDADGELYVICFDDKIFKLVVPSDEH